MLNHIVLMGRLVRDPVLRHTGSGIAVASFTLAVDRGYGEEKQTDFIDCNAWRKTGEFVDKHFSKGSQICVEGRLQSNSYTDKDGNKRTAFAVNVSNVHFAGGKQESNHDVPQDDGQLADVMSALDSLKREAPQFTEEGSAEDEGNLPF